ncbi:hypothetical protein BGZ60DRAFT_415968 [Tricladium varicosporioides]|nr:hypothetical protein BGZ60DRAFT_415968 [Hymenoscyphus varicosporioides]
MIRALHPRKQIREPFICWQCCAKYHQGVPRGRPGRRLLGPQSQSSYHDIQRWQASRSVLSKPPSRSATQASIRSNERGGALSQFDANSDVRNRLRKWQFDNGDLPVSTLIDQGERSSQSTINTSTNSTQIRGILEYNAESQDEQQCISSDEPDLVDMGGARTFLLPGDLVVLPFLGSKISELAIYIRQIDTQGQFYTMSGSWVARRVTQPPFYVPGFVEAQSLDDIIPFLPDSLVPKNREDRLNQFQQSLPRSIGKDLVKKMIRFWEEADDVYLSAASKLENAHRYVADPFRMETASLNSITEKVLGSLYPQDANGQYPEQVLFAVHRHIAASYGFQTFLNGTLRAGGVYKILSLNELNEMDKVHEIVRKYTERKAKDAPQKGPLHYFAEKCQRLIDQSREHRQFTTYGSVSPLTKGTEAVENFRHGSPNVESDATESMFIRFIESWSGFRSFPPSSPFPGTASTILRATDRYQGVELDNKTGWTFLQEIGALPPWETRGDYDIGLPGKGHRLQCEPTCVTEGFTKDKLAGIRKDWDQLPVFCIDAPDAREIDDGISIEPTDSPNEYWLHVHAADPASHIATDSPVAKAAARLVTNYYGPDRVVSMLDSSVVAEKFSLAPDRPCTTYSARINLDGEVLEHSVTAGIIRNVVSLTPDTFREIGISRKLMPKETIYSVGSVLNHAPDQAKTRLAINELSEEHKKQLQIIHSIGSQRAKLARKNGACTVTQMQFDVSVDFGGAQWEKPTISHSVRYLGDPAITISVPKQLEDIDRVDDAVAHVMLLAGNIAAKWCSERGIPIIYRVTQRDESKEDPRHYFERAVLPNMDAAGNVPTEVTHQYLQYVGSAQPSTTPGPHILAGADMLTKCTSPLRRYPDMLNAWQIGAALLEENRLGRSLVGNTSDSIFPFSKAAIDAELVRIDTIERSSRKAMDSSRRHFLAQFLFRAWKFGEAELPSPLRFVLKNKDRCDQPIGRLVEFEATATLNLSKRESFENVELNDVLEVEIEDIDVYLGQIIVKPIQKVTDPEVVQEILR